MKTFIWKHAYLSFVCNVENIELARSTFNETIMKDLNKPGLDAREMLLMQHIVNNREPIAILEDGLCAMLTRTKD